MADKAKIAAIADGLSEAQRRALTAKVGTPSEYFRKYQVVLEAADLCETATHYSGVTITRLTMEASRLRHHLQEQSQ